MPRSFEPNGAREAVAILQREVENEIELYVNFEDTVLEFEEDWRGFDEFVTAVEENPVITRLSFEGGEFGQAHEALERLFGQVLPSHRSLRKITFWNGTTIRSEYVELFTRSLANMGQSLQLLEFQSVIFLNNPQSVAAIANNLLGTNAQIETLQLHSCGVNSAGGQAIFQALSGNSHLEELHLSNNHISEIDEMGVQALASSSLRVLNISDNPLTNDTMRTLFQGLRTNCSMEELYSLPPIACPFTFALLEELLRSFHFKLEYVQIGDFLGAQQSKINDLLELNEAVRDAHENLDDDEYHVPQLSRWPDVLEEISSKPALLYRFVRQANLAAFAKQALYDPNEGLRRSCRRKRPMPRYNPSG